MEFAEMENCETRNESHLETPLVLIIEAKKQEECGSGVTSLRALVWSTILLLGVGGVVVYVSPHDPWSLGVTIGSFVILLLLYHCLHIFESTPPESPRRRTLKATVWALSTLLTVVFTYRVAVILPPVAAIIIWSMAGISMLGGFFLLFIYDDHLATPTGNDPHLQVQVDDEKPLKKGKGAGMPLNIITTE